MTVRYELIMIKNTIRDLQSTKINFAACLVYGAVYTCLASRAFDGAAVDSVLGFDGGGVGWRSNPVLGV